MKTVEEIIGYSFNDKSLLKTAFVHSSYANEHRVKSNERLEFLGDSVLSIIVTDQIFHHFKRPEGDLSKIRAALVSEKSLSGIMQELGLGVFIKTGAGLKGKPPTSAMQEDAFEALVAAIYLDGGMEEARRFVLRVMRGAMSDIDHDGVPDSNKSRLQEKLVGAKIVYKTETDGEGLYKTYTSRVFVNGVMSGIGHGNKKKLAEELAAKEAFEKIKSV